MFWFAGVRVSPYVSVRVRDVEVVSQRVSCRVFVDVRDGLVVVVVLGPVELFSWVDEGVDFGADA